MASLLIALVGVLFIVVGAWILLLRFENLADIVSPHSVAVGQMTVNGEDSKPHAELLRARFDHHFRRPVSRPRETGFLEAVTLDAPKLFRERDAPGALDKVTLEVSGVDLTRVLQFINLLIRPGQWVIEGDFRTQADRAVLALRLTRGTRLIRTWYLERPGSAADKSALLQQLVDDAIFQLVYDFGNTSDTNPDMKKWRGVVPLPPGATSPAAVGAYFEARGALSRYFGNGDWADLDLAIARLRTLRAEMPTFPDGLQLLGMALAERRNETEAIHVYEQLLLLLRASGDAPSPAAMRRLRAVELLQASATVRLYSWQSTHTAVAELLALFDHLEKETLPTLPPEDRAAYTELRAQTAAQLAHAYALYLSYMRDHAVAEVFTSAEAPAALRVSDGADIQALSQGPPSVAKPIVLRVARAAIDEHRRWLDRGRQEQTALEPQWSLLTADRASRKAELASRLAFAEGYAHYRIAEWEPAGAGSAVDPVFGESFERRLARAAVALAEADAAHPNHYLILQFLGLVNSEPRSGEATLSVAEQYLERAVQVNPADYYGRELLAGLLLRRTLRAGVDLTSRIALEKGLAQATAAVEGRETSGNAHLLKAQFLTLLLEIERVPARRKELLDTRAHALEQAGRLLPNVFRRPDVDLTWLRLVADLRRLGDELAPPDASDGQLGAAGDGRPRFAAARAKLLTDADDLLAACQELERRWVNNQRLEHVKALVRRVQQLRSTMSGATERNWRDIAVAFQ